ncbi:hypothetical protein OSB04_025701 [Centaurea solstitialis]|uniref:Pectinesterase inhibitor domain-containing protein n=1 Tax=Centaurea solstitialis TaxID=347529 RepID=A0AA38SQ69_9ASTR|nr:hypothetical protein OSB04_025701 [Centaurea solstitialis]
MGSSSFSKIFIFSVVSFFLISNAYADVSYELVNQVCSKVDKVDFCLEVLKSDGRSEFAKDVTTLTRVAVDASIQNSTNTRDNFQSVESGPPEVLQSLKDCVDAYNNVIAILRVCMSEEDCSLTGYDIHQAGDEVRRCQAVIDSNGAHESFITSSNNVVQDFCWLSESLSNISCKNENKF